MVCGAMGLCRSQQFALAQLQSNEIPKVDLAQPMSPFMLNVPQLLFPQESPKQESPKKVKHISLSHFESLVLSMYEHKF